ncbi:MAG: hypothetical protein JXR73_03545, partial [Candidatus Omnitrophica bacterium]|nr:hypothetical protein [Candidatus Omnitrophota bacterium]
SYWTLGHVAASDDGPAGWEFGQTNDGRNSNGLSNVRTGGHNEWVIIRINIVDTTPGDGKSRIKAWQDGILVYDSVRGDDITEFGEIAFRRTSGGNEQHMEIDWLRMSFEDAYAPGAGPDTPNGANDSPHWDFVYYGNELPESIVENGGLDWQPRSGETNGRPKYDSIIVSPESQVGGLWSRIDDNSEDPDAPGASEWARGYLFGTDVYDKWNGRMTLVLRIKDLGTDSQKSVVDITNSADNYWTLGHVAESGDGPAGWEFGQTNDSRNGNDVNGITDVRVGGFGEFSILRITIVDDVPGDGSSMIRGWKNGVLVYESQRTDDISLGEFGEIAFRRTSGGSAQKMEIDWVLMKFGNAWAPGAGGQTPAGVMDGAGANIVNLPKTGLIDGALGADTRGLLRSVHDASQGAGLNGLYDVDANNVPTNLSLFYLGFDAIRDMEVAANDKGVLTGVMALDKYAVVHSYSVEDPGESVSGPGVPSNPPRIDYAAEVSQYNAANPSDPVILPFFGGFDENGAFQGLDLTMLGYTDFTGADNGIARDIELAVDWRTTTNAFQGYYMLDAFGGIHYVNNAEIIAFLNVPANEDILVTLQADSNGAPVVREPIGYQKFHNIFGFKPKYSSNYVGVNPSDEDLYNRAPAPYFYGLPIARDLEVMSHFDPITSPSGAGLVEDSMNRDQIALESGIDTANLFTSIKMDENRNLPSSPKFGPQVAVTNGYAILDAFGGVHSLLEDKDGNPIPAPWETVENGSMDPGADAPYFYTLDLAVDLEIFPNGNGFALLTRLGEVYIVNGNGTTEADNFAMTGMADDLPFFGFDAARDLTLVPNAEGKIAGMYVVDRFGTVHTAGQVPDLPSRVLFFPSGYALDLEVSPYVRPYSTE